MKKKRFIVALVIISTFALSSCGIQKNAQKNFLGNMQVTTKRAPQQTFYDLTQGVQVTVVPTNPSEEMTGYVLHLSGKPIFTASTVNYVRSMGFKEKSPSTDYRLFITIKQADLNGWDGTCYMGLEVALKDFRGTEVFYQGNIFASAQNAISLPNGLAEAYTQALERVDWSRIASFLRLEDLPKNEPNKQVQGLGDTALEHLTIHWNIDSRPQGADISWRVISSTPEVKNQNYRYLNTTPYESTETFDIKGLTYNNSGDVQIEIKCEKTGYYTNSKKFNALSIIDEKEINAFFRLVKEE